MSRRETTAEEKDCTAKTASRGLVRRVCGRIRARALGSYPFRQARRFRVSRQIVHVPNLPVEFAGTTIAFLTDIHHGPFFGAEFVRSIVCETNLLGADIVALGGDYAHVRRKYLAACIVELAGLSARHGVYAVLGNHDHVHSARRATRALSAGGITVLTNCGVWLDKKGARLRLCGVDDLWAGRPDLEAALGDCGPRDTAILLSHNPLYAARVRDGRVGLVLSGHTHGGQINLPLIGPPSLLLKRRRRLALSGLVQTPHTQVYVSHGLGAVFPFVRYNCRGEIALLEIRPA